LFGFLSAYIIISFVLSASVIVGWNVGRDLSNVNDKSSKLQADILKCR
jgi:hypothetical protein